LTYPKSALNQLKNFMHDLISDEELSNLAEEFHVIEDEISCLIRLLCCVRQFREDIALA
jgi:hypothetical protein